MKEPMKSNICLQIFCPENQILTPTKKRKIDRKEKGKRKKNIKNTWRSRRNTSIDNRNNVSKLTTNRTSNLRISEDTIQDEC